VRQALDQRARARPLQASQRPKRFTSNSTSRCAGAVQARVQQVRHAVRADGRIDHRLPGDDRRHALEASGSSASRQRLLQVARGAVHLARGVHREGVELVRIVFDRATPASAPSQRGIGTNAEEIEQVRHCGDPRHFDRGSRPAAQRSGCAALVLERRQRVLQGQVAAGRVAADVERLPGGVRAATSRAAMRTAATQSRASSASSSTAACRGPAGAAP
jgi:hypothetical protein